MNTQEKQKKVDKKAGKVDKSGEKIITERWKIPLTKQKIINVEVILLGNKNHMDTRRISNI